MMFRGASRKGLGLAPAMVAAAILSTAGFTQSAPPAGAFRIAGRVVNAVTGDPVPQARVTALSEMNYQAVAFALTDAEGNFSISGLRADKYPLTASRRGFRTSYFDEHEGFNTAIVTGPDQDTEHLVFRMAPDAVIFGTVTGDGGDPVENANIMLFRINPSAPERQPQQIRGARTDDTGAYEIDNLSDGQYLIAASAQPWYAIHPAEESQAPGENNLDVAFPLTFFDSTTEAASATPIVVAAGSRNQADVAMHAVPAVHIRVAGQRIRANNWPRVEVRQSVFGMELPPPSGIQRVANGAMYISGLAPGQYQLTTGDPPRTVEVNATSNAEVDPSSGTPLQPVEGTVRMMDGSAVGELSLIFQRTDRQVVTFPVNAMVRNGRFHVDGVSPGEWTLVPTSFGPGNRPLFVASVLVDGAPAAGNQIVVRDRPVTAAVTLTTSQSRIVGFAQRDGKPASGVMVVLVPGDPAAYSAFVRRDQSDSDGSFTLPRALPGRYTVVAIADGWKLDWQDRNVIERYVGTGEPVTVGGQPGAVIRLSQPVQAVTR